jgi:hypothetical protein
LEVEVNAPPRTTVVPGNQLIHAAQLIKNYIAKEGLDGTVGLNAALLLFVLGMITSGHTEQDAHDALERCYRMLDSEKPS